MICQTRTDLAIFAAFLLYLCLQFLVNIFMRDHVLQEQDHALHLGSGAHQSLHHHLPGALPLDAHVLLLLEGGGLPLVHQLLLQLHLLCSALGVGGPGQLGLTEGLGRDGGRRLDGGSRLRPGPVGLLLLLLLHLGRGRDRRRGLRLDWADWGGFPLLPGRARLPFPLPGPASLPPRLRLLLRHQLAGVHPDVGGHGLHRLQKESVRTSDTNLGTYLDLGCSSRRGDSTGGGHGGGGVAHPSVTPAVWGSDGPAHPQVLSA